MKTFKEHLITERYVNLIAGDERKQEYADQIYDMLQKAYAKIGGIHGNGFKSPEDMIKNIPFWKFEVKGGVPLACILYKDKGGRKSVAVATNGTPAGKDSLARMMRADVMQGRSYSEKSGPALGFVKKQLSPGVFNATIMTYKDAQKILDDPIRPAPKDDEEYKRHPELKGRLYQREIGGEWHTKAMLGTIGNTIK